MGKKYWILYDGRCRRAELPACIWWVAPDGTIDLVDLSSAGGRYTVPHAFSYVSQALSRPVYRAPAGVNIYGLLHVAAEMVVMHIWAQQTMCDLWNEVVAEMLRRRDADGGRLG